MTMGLHFTVSRCFCNWNCCCCFVYIFFYTVLDVVSIWRKRRIPFGKRPNRFVQTYIPWQSTSIRMNSINWFQTNWKKKKNSIFFFDVMMKCVFCTNIHIGYSTIALNIKAFSKRFQIIIISASFMPNACIFVLIFLSYDVEYHY